jgi:hypothetical protein
VTFKDLQKVIESQPDTGLDNQLQLQKLRGKPFWIWDRIKHKESDRITKGECCFWHIIKPPQKDGRDMPVLPYQKTLFDALQKHKHIWILKSRGIGCSEFLLRYIAWCCITEIISPISRVCIVTGPGIDLAEDLIARFKGLFLDKKSFIQNDRTQSTVAFLNGVRVEAFPSHHVDTMRGLTDVKFILSDESDMYPLFQQREVRAVMEGYIVKPNSDPHIVLVSTPKAPGGLMQQIELEENSLYHKLRFDYRYGLEGQYPIYSEEQIGQARLSPEFGREFELQYLGLVGNVFSQLSIEIAQKIQYNPENINPNAKKSIGIDPGFGSSKFARVITQYVDGKIQVIHAEEYDRPNFAAMIDTIWQLKQKCGYVSNVYVDAANPEVWESLKREFGEPFNQQYISDKIAECKKYNLHIEDRMIVVPVPFSTEGAHMLQHSKWLMEETEEGGQGGNCSLIAIDKRYDKLLTALRTAVANEYKLDKEQTSYNDLLDAFRLSLTFYKRRKN